MFTNGLIKGYTVHCWYIENQEKIPICDEYIRTSPITRLEYILHNLLHNATYYCQVRAHTKIGAGPYSDLLNIWTGRENPVPDLLVATTDAMIISDLDRKSNSTINREIAIEVAYLAEENKIYWINEMQELLTSEMDGTNATKILSLNNTALSLCIDWIAKNLYWSEFRNKESDGHIIKLDLTMWQAGIVKYKSIVKRTKRIKNLDILPSQRYVCPHM